MPKITSHFAPVVPFHPTKRDPADGDIKTLRPKTECGDDWCLNGPPIQNASTYFLCSRCSRDSTDPVYLCSILKAENKRRPAPSKTADTQARAKSHSIHPSPIPDFDFDFMIDYCLDYYGDFALHKSAKSVTMKFVNKADRWFRYRYYIMADIEYSRSRKVEIMLRPADKLVAEVIKHFFYKWDDPFPAKLLYRLFTNFGWAMYGAHPIMCEVRYKYPADATEPDRPTPDYQFKDMLERSIQYWGE